jgi:hypothetical protein
MLDTMAPVFGIGHKIQGLMEQGFYFQRRSLHEGFQTIFEFSH